MADALRITVDELKKRMEAGEGFTLIDVRNPHAWAESDTALPEAIRITTDNLEENLPRTPKNRPAQMGEYLLRQGLTGKVFLPKLGVLRL